MSRARGPERLASGQATAVVEGAKPPQFFLENEVTKHRAHSFSGENWAPSLKNFLRPPRKNDGPE